jgi:hypothetical protein
MDHAFGCWDDNIVIKTSEGFSLGAERFSNLTLDFVSLNGGSASFERNSEAKMPQVVGNPKNSALPQAKYFRAIEESPVFPRVMEPMAAG